MLHSSNSKRLILAIVALGFIFITSLDLRAQTTYKRGAIIEEFTGTWCPHCPPGAWALDSMQQMYGDALVEIAWHGPFAPPYNEPLSLRAGDTLSGAFGISSDPIGLFQRAYVQGFGITNPPPGVPVWIGNYTWPGVVDNTLNSAATLDYRIVNATYDPASHKVDFDIDITPFDMSKMRIDDTTQYATLAVLTEDNISNTDPQQNAGDWSVVAAGQIDDFHHMNVARLVSGNVVFGDKITLGTKTPSETLPVRRHYTMTVKTPSWDPTMIRVKTIIQAGFPKSSIKSLDVLEAKQTGYVTSLPASVSNSVWVVLPNSKSVIQNSTVNIVWSKGGTVGNGKLEYSTDGGNTWNAIVGAENTSASPYVWTPKFATDVTAMIRVSDASSSGTYGLSEPFQIPAIKSSFTITAPKSGDIIPGGTTNYSIKYTALNTGVQRTFEFTSDGGTTWIPVTGTPVNSTTFNWTTVPNVATTQGVIRVTDEGGIRGTSGMFTISVAGAKGTITNVALYGLQNTINGIPSSGIDNNRNLAVQWGTTTGSLGTGLDVYFSSNSGTDWTKETSAPLTTDQTSFTFKTPKTGFYPNCSVKVQSSSDPTIHAVWSDSTGITFAVGQSSGVYMSGVSSGYSISNYPNPFASQTTIKFTLPVRTYVTIEVLDNLGRIIEHLVTQTLDAGEHIVPFTSANLANGVYTYTLEAGATKLVGKMSIVK